MSYQLVVRSLEEGTIINGRSLRVWQSSNVSYSPYYRHRMKNLREDIITRYCDRIGTGERTKLTQAAMHRLLVKLKDFSTKQA